MKVFHGGLDLISQQGESVVAAADGVVKEVTHSTKGLGNVVTIDHGNGYLTRYAHLENTRVTKGQKLARDGISARSGCPETRSHRIFITRFSRIPCGWIR